MMEELTPQRIVQELDRYIVGQEEAKRALAIALRNRYRRRMLPSDIRDDVVPKNILMIGPTGVGKTEIARRVAKLIDAPFVKVEATKFTEVGYVGRDVESMIRELVEAAVSMVHERKVAEVQKQATDLANERLIGYLLEQGRVPIESSQKRKGMSQRRRRIRVAEMLQNNLLEDEIVEIDVEGGEILYLADIHELSSGEAGEGLGDIVEGYRSRKRSRKVPVREARRILTQEEANKLIDFDQVVDEALEKVEELGVVFIDEIDKIAGKTLDAGSDVSGEGVQRDLLPIVEGSTVSTRYGNVKTDHILFIAAGAFHSVKPSDLIPEFQGRFPLRVELKSLNQQDLLKILLYPENSLPKQYKALLATEGLELDFTEDGLAEIARLAFEINSRTEDIGARRLHTIMEQVLEDISFRASEMRGTRFVVDREYVAARMANLVKDEDLSRYIL
jgi:ATP-dependent HslUV protease ATP-binding subunit HslU